MNNVYVSAINHGWDTHDYIARFPLDHVGEFHVAGHATVEDSDGSMMLIDAHDGVTSEPMMALLSQVLTQKSDIPALIEWDNDLPNWVDLYREVKKISTALHARKSDHEITDVA